MKYLDREQRIKVYKRALETFTKHAAKLKNGDECDGMCDHISRAANYLRFGAYEIDASDMQEVRKTFPEYRTFKPKYCHRSKSDWSNKYTFTGYWWSTKSPRGWQKRIEILTALANGQSKS